MLQIGATEGEEKVRDFNGVLSLILRFSDLGCGGNILILPLVCLIISLTPLSQLYNLKV
jgi:hypothetical protein